MIMSDPEIKIKFSADATEVADELDKVTKNATEAVSATDKLVSSWATYKQNVREAEAEVRKLNATQFENAEQRDAAINTLGDKLDALVYEGKAIEDSVKAIGISPESLQGFDSITATLNRANKELEIALNYKEKLLNQPTTPANALVTTNPWEEGPDGGGPAEFKARMEEMRAELEAYAAQMGNAIAANDQMKSALEAELASLDKSAAGYAEQKKLLEGLISACDSYSVSSETQRQSLQKQKATFEELNKETLASEKWDEGLKSIDKYGEEIVSTSLKVQKSIGSQIAIQNRYENAVLSAQQKELKGQVKLQSQMEMAGKSREELIRLVEEYGKALAKAQTKEEYEAAAAGISAARKQLTLLTREASLTGSAMIGSQTSVQGLVATIGRLGVQGRLTFKALSDGIKLFAKSTLVLAGIQFAWEGITWVMEKAKIAIFGAADAEGEAAQKAEDLAKATRDANAALRESQMALSAWRDDQARAADATAFADALKAQNEQYDAQIKLVQKATEAKLYDASITAKDEERGIAFERLELQQKKIDGTISELAYKKAIIELERKAAISKIDLTKKKSAIDKESAENELKLAQDNFNRIKNTERKSLEGFEREPEKVKEAIDAYNELDATVKENNKEFGRLINRQHELDKRLEKYKKQGFDKSDSQYNRFLYDKAQAEWYRNQIKLNEFQAQERALITARENLPKIVREYGINEKGLSQYTKTRKGILEYNKPLEKEEEEAKKDVAKKAAAKEKKDAEYARIQAESLKETSAAFEAAKLKTENAVKEKKQADKDKKNQEEIKAIKENIHSLSIAELRKQEADLKAKDKKAKSSRNRDRIRARAAVYSDEIQRREDELERKASAYNAGIFNEDGRFRTSQGKSARRFVTEGLSPDTNEEARFTNKLAQIAQDVVTSGRVKSNLIAKVEAAAKAVQTTSGTNDDAALERVVALLIQVINATEKNKAALRKANTRLKKLQRITIDQDL